VARARKSSRYLRAPPSRVVTGTRSVRDSSTAHLPLIEWLGGHGADPVASAERRGEDLLRSNRGLLSDMRIEADVVRGKTLTSWPSVRRDLENAGATWIDRELVEDENLITSRKPGDLDVFCQALESQI